MIKDKPPESQNVEVSGGCRKGNARGSYKYGGSKKQVVGNLRSWNSRARTRDDISMGRTSAADCNCGLRNKSSTGAEYKWEWVL